MYIYVRFASVSLNSSSLGLQFKFNLVYDSVVWETWERVYIF